MAVPPPPLEIFQEQQPPPQPPPQRRRNTITTLRQMHHHWNGAKPIPFLISISIGLIFRLFVPKPAKLTHQAWSLLSIFLTTILGLILSPLPLGAWAMVCVTISVSTKTLSFSSALSAATSEIIWLIVISFFFARGFVKTGLGERIASWFVKMLGKSTLGLSYGLVICEAVVAPAMPSSTARAGGVFGPIIKSLAVNAGSSPEERTKRRLGSFLIQSQLQVWFF